MARKPIASLAVAAVIALAVATAVRAQVPPHAPGTVCVTPKFWCWARPPGRPGLACYCPTPNGPVRGVFG